MVPARRTPSAARRARNPSLYVPAPWRTSSGSAGPARDAAIATADNHPAARPTKRTRRAAALSALGRHGSVRRWMPPSPPCRTPTGCRPASRRASSGRPATTARTARPALRRWSPAPCPRSCRALDDEADRRGGRAADIERLYAPRVLDLIVAGLPRHLLEPVEQQAHAGRADRKPRTAQSARKID